MRRFAVMCAAMTVLIAGGANAGPRKIVEPLDPAVVAQLQVVAVDVDVSETARPNFEKFEAKAAEKRVAAGLTPVDGSAAPTTRPAKADYATLPFRQMFPLVMEDVTREWGLSSGTPVKLKVTIDTVKTANAGMAILAASSDQLAAMVEVLDAQDGRALGSFYIDVINSHGGLGGLALRGSGIREKLAEEFALESSRVLTGRKSKTPKAKKS